MSFWFQLKLILWKNFLVRKRQKVRLVVEIIWPLFLFLILMWVRTRGLRTSVHDCHFTEKAMPSTGFLPFVQSFICTLNNTCHPDFESSKVYPMEATAESLAGLVKEIQGLYNGSDHTVPLSNSSLSNVLEFTRNLRDLLRFLEFMDKLEYPNTKDKNNRFLSLADFLINPNKTRENVKDKLKMTPEVFDRVISAPILNELDNPVFPLVFTNDSQVRCVNDINKLADRTDTLNDVLCKLNQDESKELRRIFMNDWNKEYNFDDVNYYVKNQLQNTLSWPEWRESLALYSNLEKSAESFPVFLNSVSNENRTENTMAVARALRQADANMSVYKDALKIIKTFFCGEKEADDFINSLLPQSGTILVIEDIREKLKNQTTNRYRYDDDFSPECNDVFRSLEDNPLLKIIWRSFKHMILGRILYTPVTPFTKRVMDRVNNTYFPMAALKSAIERLSSFFTNPVLRSLSNNITSIQKFINSPTGRLLFNNTQELNNINEMFKEAQDAILRLGRNASPTNPWNSSFYECLEMNKIWAYDNGTEAELEAFRLLENDRLWALIVFETEKLPRIVNYTIRMSSDYVDNTELHQDRHQNAMPRRRPLVDLKYITFGFAYLQDMIELSVISEKTNLTNLPGTILQQVPFACHIEDEFVQAITGTFPLLMVLSWVYTCSMLVKSIVYEKEQRLKETMRVMGLGNGIHWVGWFIDTIIPMSFTTLLLSAVLTYGKILTYSNFWALYFFLFCHVLSTISLSFLISVFFSRANIAAACAGIIYFMLYLPYPFLIRWMTIFPTLGKILMSLSTNVALGIGSFYIVLYEEAGKGYQWDNMGESPVYGDDFTVSNVIYMFLLDSFLYLIITWYVEGVRPGQYGIPRKWYFPVQLSYWTGKYPTVIHVTPSKTNNGVSADFEQEPSDVKSGVSVVNLTKIFGNGKVAVDNLSINFYENQITSFLGHNGAGKTTTISILTGLFPPTSGTAVINGYDIRTEMDKIRKNLGMCPQHNVLFNRLTVEEHLWFYGRLRGNNKLIDDEVEQMLTDLNLQHKRKTFTTNLSGGMQRKLSIALAFIGGSKVVILDEPTSGVDPYSRRSIWELLTKYKMNRTVILTTHYMDEADLLGDRIAIISVGKVKCCGSSLFLKRRFGSGYSLTVELVNYSASVEAQLNDRYQQNSPSQNPEELEVTKFVRKSIPSARVLEFIGNEMIFILPEKNPLALSSLCSQLDDNLNRLGIVSYGISDTSLEEIFINQAEDSSDAQMNAKGRRFFSKKPKLLETEPDTEVQGEKTVQLNGSVYKYAQVPILDKYEVQVVKKPSNRYLRQFMALHVKRFHHTKRNGKALFSELVLPAALVALSLLVLSLLPALRNRPLAELSVWSLYRQPFYFYFENKKPRTPWTDAAVESVIGPYGLGTVCMRGYDDSWGNGTVDPWCRTKGRRSFVNDHYVAKKCSCFNGYQKCPADVINPPPSWFELASRDTMYNLTDVDIPDWVLSTSKIFGKTKLHGGFSFGANLTVPNQGIGSLFLPEQLQSLLPSGMDFLRRGTDSTNNIKVWFNNKNWLSHVSNMNAIHNNLLRVLLKSNNSASHGIIANSHPMGFTDRQLEVEIILRSGFALLQAISVIFALSFVTASFTLYLIEERMSNSKHLQLVSGVNRLVYWVEAFVWDMCAYMVACFLCIFIFLMFKSEAYVGKDSFPAFFLLLTLYGWACIPLMYPASFIFNVPSSAFVVLSCANMFIGIVTTITTTVLSTFPDEELQRVASIIREIFIIFPHFCLGDGMIKLATNYLASASFLALDIAIEQDAFGWDFLGKNLVFLFGLGIIFFATTLAIEFEIFGRFKRSIKPEDAIGQKKQGEEEDVLAERHRVYHNPSDLLVIEDLTKVYNRKADPSVNKICVGVKKGECFGLLGLNGAGKTTTFKMLTGAIHPTTGDARVGGFSITSDIDQVRALLGYCPQFDALDPLLTPYEHLILYAKIRNIPSEIIHSRVDRLLRRMGLSYYRDSLTGTLSGGNKRKLSTAIALIGSPPLVFLDEPTTGMDPKARRFLWSCIHDIVKQGGCVILTSHSMEECQALCTRLTIMVNGQFQCLGSSQHLKTKYGKGYLIIIRCAEDTKTKVKEFMRKNLSSSKITEEHYNQIRYEIPIIRVTELFHEMEKAKSKRLVIDYSISQTTLEEVFIRFAREQSDPYERAERKSAIKHFVNGRIRHRRKAEGI